MTLTQKEIERGWHSAFTGRSSSTNWSTITRDSRCCVRRSVLLPLQPQMSVQRSTHTMIRAEHRRQATHTRTLYNSRQPPTLSAQTSGEGCSNDRTTFSLNTGQLSYISSHISHKARIRCSSDSTGNATLTGHIVTRCWLHILVGGQVTEAASPPYFSVRVAVFPFSLVWSDAAMLVAAATRG